MAEKKTVWANHSFYWKTNLSEDRMREIDDLLGGMTPYQRAMIGDLIGDVREEQRFEDDYGHSLEE